jgi:predicted negative regulator of RcsB-dependent stress response
MLAPNVEPMTWGGYEAVMARVGAGAGSVAKAVARWSRKHLKAWIIGAAPVNAALVTLISVAVALPGQSGTRVKVLLLVLLAVLVLSVIFPVIGEREARRKRRHEQIDPLLLRGSAVGLPRLSDISDDLLGVTPTKYSIEGCAPYVAREAPDEMIRRFLSQPGPPYPFVIVWGTTKSGKSRTLAEALRAMFSSDTVVVLPRDGQALASLARLDVAALVDHRPAVVLLDDLNPADLGALTPEVLDSIRGWAVIAATMTAKRRADALNIGGGVGTVARAALAVAARSGEYELASGPPTGEEKDEAERLYPQVLFNGSIAETLVGARDLIARYRAGQNSDAAGCAVVRAAIDARRAGIARPVTEAELGRLFPSYLAAVSVGAPPTAEQFADGIRWAEQPVASQVALLRPTSRVVGERAWVVFDHAVTADDSPHGGRPIPAATWNELIDVIPPEDCLSVGITAASHFQLEASVTALRKATASSRPDDVPLAAISLAQLLIPLGRYDEAREAFQIAVDSQHPYIAPVAAAPLGLILEQQGKEDEACEAYQLAVTSTQTDIAAHAGLNLGKLLQKRGGEEDFGMARNAFQSVIDSGSHKYAPNAALRLGKLLWDCGDIEGARAALQFAIDSADVESSRAAKAVLELLLMGS